MPSSRGTLEGSIFIHPERPVQTALCHVTPCSVPLLRAAAGRWGRSRRRQRRVAGRKCLECSYASIEQSQWNAVVPIRRLLIGPPNLEDRTLIVGPPDELQTTRQAVPGKPIGHLSSAFLQQRRQPSCCMPRPGRRSRRLPEGCYRTRRAKARLKKLCVDVSPFRNADAESDEQGEGEATSLTP